MEPVHSSLCVRNAVLPGFPCPLLAGVSLPLDEVFELASFKSGVHNLLYLILFFAIDKHRRWWLRWSLEEN